MQTTHNITYWTDEVNKLVQERKPFALAITFGDYKEVENSLYEYDPILVDVLNLSTDIIQYGAGYSMHKIINFDVDKQYVVVKDDNISHKTFVLGQWTSHNEAEENIKKDCSNLSDKNGENDENYTYNEYVIVDLTNLQPYFFGKGIIAKQSKSNKNNGQFYDWKGSKVSK